MGWRHVAAGILCLFLGLPGASAEVIRDGPMTTAAFWQERNPAGDRVLLAPDAVADLNRRIEGAGVGLVDLASLPPFFDGTEVRRGMENFWMLRGNLWTEGRRASGSDKERLKSLTDAASVPLVIRGEHGVTVRHTDVRNMPTDKGWFTSPGDRYYDRIQDSTLDAGEPVLILHRSADGNYLYVQLYQLRGWIRAADIARCGRQQWLEYARPERFVTVTGRDWRLDTGQEELFFLQGSRLPLKSPPGRGPDRRSGEGWKVLVPQRDGKGRLRTRTVEVPATAPLKEGPQPYTSNQLLENAFRFLGNEYGWGNSLHSVDCSGLVDAVYRGPGIRLPRNTAAIRKAPGTFRDLRSLDRKEKLRVIGQLPPGSLLNLDGHVMLYLGSVNGVPYVLHSASSYYENGRKVYVRRVVVSDLELGRAAGGTFLDTLLSCQTFDSVPENR